MSYHQITPAERYTLGALRKQGYSNAEIARITDRHRSTIGREFQRNCAKHDGAYRHSKAQERTNGRRSRSRRNSHGPPEKRGRLMGKRHISERPAAAEMRSEIGHWEMDVVIGAGNQHCIVTLVERKTGATLIGKLRCRKVVALNPRVIELIQAHP